MWGLSGYSCPRPTARQSQISQDLTWRHAVRRGTSFGYVASSVVLAEDSYIVREGMRRLLDAEDGLDLVATCEGYDELIASVAELSPDVVVTDIRMPPTRTDEGVRAALEIRSRWPNTGIVVLSQYAEPGYVLSLFEHGTAGLAYLLKERVGDFDQVVNAIERVRSNGSVVDPLIVEVLVKARAGREQSKLNRLTPGEIGVLEQIAGGKTNAALARDLHLSERTVESRINSIFTKLDLSQENDLNKRVRAVVLWLTEQHP